MARMNELRCEMDRPALLRRAVEPFYSFSPLDALWLVLVSFNPFSDKLLHLSDPKSSETCWSSPNKFHSHTSWLGCVDLCEPPALRAVVRLASPPAPLCSPTLVGRFRWLGLMRDFQAGQKKLAVQSLIIRGCVLVLGANEPSSLTPYLSSAINDPQRISYTSLSNIVTSLVPVDTAVTRIPLLSIAATAAGPVGDSHSLGGGRSKRHKAQDVHLQMTQAAAAQSRRRGIWVSIFARLRH
ncbi:hypothetical protein PCASD_17529 [Puccinia coronata f. sp. avenae]|uniref:Uncharacterized protein n=1 Tax=Puccinia coronata f. sp. avenae TaxID=200324 RepID=A0A2N5U3T2_9BASI|nr:hypothetical protein PCASD_17529 [Puccinia coronata f. sp. avenae]